MGSSRTSGTGRSDWNKLGRRLEFFGGTVLAVARMVSGRARYRRADLLLALQQAGHEALPIAGVIGFLLGAVLAFVGAVGGSWSRWKMARGTIPRGSA